MAKERKNNKTAAKRPIEQYDHKKDKRLNNPPAGLVHTLRRAIIDTREDRALDTEEKGDSAYARRWFCRLRGTGCHISRLAAALHSMSLSCAARGWLTWFGAAGQGAEVLARSEP